MGRTVLLISTLVVSGLLSAPAAGQDFTNNGFITTWYFLGPYENTAGCAPGNALISADWLTDGGDVTEETFFPTEDMEVETDCTVSASGIDPCYKNPSLDFVVPTVELVTVDTINEVTLAPGITNVGGAGEIDTVNFNTFWHGTESDGCPTTNPITGEAMAYAVTYLRNNTGQAVDVVGETGHDDSIQILINSGTVFLRDGWCQHMGNSGVIQNTFSATLNPGVNRIMVKLFEGCGHWAFRLRFRTECSLVTEPDFEIVLDPPPPDQLAVRVTRDLPDFINPGETIDVSLDVEILGGNPSSGVLTERLPLGYTYVDGSASDGGVHASGVITWNLDPLQNTTLTYQVVVPDIIVVASFTGELITDGFSFSVGGDLGPDPLIADPGWVRDWLILDGIDQGTNNNSGKNPGDPLLLRDWITDDAGINEQTVVPAEGDEISTVFDRGDPNLSPGTRYITDLANEGLPGTWQVVNVLDGNVNYNNIFSAFKTQGFELEVMAYGAFYVESEEEMDAVLAVGTDDSGKALVNGEVVWTVNVGRGFNPANGPQNRIPIRLREGKNLVMLGAWDGCGGWNMAARLESPDGSVLAFPVTLDPDGYEPPGAGYRIERDIPADLEPGESGIVTISVTPTAGSGAVTIIERLPDGFTGSDPDRGGVVSDAGSTITWDLGVVDDLNGVVLSYTMTVDAAVGFDTPLGGEALVDDKPAPIGGDTVYTNTPLTPNGFIKIWNHLGPLADAFPPTAGDHAVCDGRGGAELQLDWIVDEDVAVTEETVMPFPGLITRPQYGGDGLPDGTGARAAGLVLEAGDLGLVSQDVFPAWKGQRNDDDTIDHVEVHGFDAEDHLTISQVYVTNNTAGDIDGILAYASDDAMVIWWDDVIIHDNPVCRGFGGANFEQNTLPLTLSPGTHRLMIKVTDGCCPSGFRLRIKDPEADLCGAGALVPPDVTYSLIPEGGVPGSVERSFASPTFTGGEPVAVTLRAQAPTASNITIFEQVPGTPSEISDNGSFDQISGTITWNLTGVTDRSVTYELAAANCTGAITYGQSTFLVGNDEVIVSGADTLTREVGSGELAAGWESEDIGSTGGGVDVLQDGVDIRGIGARIGFRQDEFHYVHTGENGDWEISARLDCQEAASTSSTAGLMARENSEVFSAYLFLSTNPQGRIQASKRRETSSTRISQAVTLTGNTDFTYPVYLKMAKAGGVITMSRSDDGAAYEEIGSMEIGTTSSQINLPDDVRLGLAVTSTTSSSSSIAAFREIGGTVPPLGGTTRLQMLRADSNNDGRVNIADAQFTLNRLFLGGPPHPCEAQADSNNDGRVNIADAQFTLNSLFLGGPAPPAPYPDCGDATDRDLAVGCETSRCAP